MIRVAVVDDHPVYRHGVARAISTCPDMQLVADVEGVEDLELASQSAPDVVVLDLGLRTISGVNAVELVRSQGPYVLVLSTLAARETVIDAIRAGAHGYLSKESDEQEIIGAIKTVATGARYVSPTLAGYLLSDEQSATADQQHNFTPRQREILSLLAEGDTVDEIRVRLSLSKRTVEGHIANCMDKTGLRRSGKLAAYARKHGIRPSNRHGEAT